MASNKIKKPIRFTDYYFLEVSTYYINYSLVFPNYPFWVNNKVKELTYKKKFLSDVGKWN